MSVCSYPRATTLDSRHGSLPDLCNRAALYAKTMEAFGGTVFAQGRRGASGVVKHLKKGRQLVLLFYQNVFRAPLFKFLEMPANTAVSAAELALRYSAPRIPFHGISQPDGLNFEVVFEAPFRHSDVRSMMQSLNDSLSARVHRNPGRWFWIHR